MDSDAVLFFSYVFLSNDFTSKNVLMVKSFLKNNNIDINFSIRENALLCTDKDNLNNIINSKDVTLDVPIYTLLMNNSCFYDILLQNIKVGKLCPLSIYNIFNDFFIYLNYLENEEYSVIADFVIKLLAAYKDGDKRILQSLYIENLFVNKNDYLLYTVKNKGENISSYNDYITKLLIIKLFTLGFITFNYPQISQSQSNKNGLDVIIRPLVRNRNYGHLKLMLNKYTVNVDMIDQIISIIDEETLKFSYITEMDSLYIEEIKEKLNSMKNIYKK